MRDKNKFQELSEDHIVHCKICNSDLLKSNFTYQKVNSNCTVGICKYCHWLIRHKNIIPIIDGWEEQDVKEIIKFILMNNSIYINDLLLILKNKTLKEICLAVTKLHIGNYSIKVKTNCAYCGQEIILSPSKYLINKNSYCSNNCYYKDKSAKTPKGVNSPFYIRIHTKCSCCGKQIDVIPFDYNKTNKFGDNFNFCSQECCYKFRSLYYINDKCPAYHRKLSEDSLNKIKLSLIQNTTKKDRLNTKIQVKINELLDSLNIGYYREFIMDFYSMDNYLYDQNLIIEVMGNYWHCNPLIYNETKYLISEKQKKWIANDKAKRTYILNHFYIHILYLWESDINNNIILCQKLIEEYIKNKGILMNYHSFNYYIEDNMLKLSKNLIIPYQEKNIDFYRNLLKK